ncbi:hypothetical protein BSPLISOX_351 [uncultured Gammaproteobacteria bacterium]|nr:hypothetical protein BSPLISOX_351 [uncultured Gammaproteobacteria bacterium]
MVEENLMISWTRIIIPQGVNVPIIPQADIMNLIYIKPLEL